MIETVCKKNRHFVMKLQDIGSIKLAELLLSLFVHVDSVSCKVFKVLISVVFISYNIFQPKCVHFCDTSISQVLLC